jgi:hypothetical protein
LQKGAPGRGGKIRVFVGQGASQDYRIKVTNSANSTDDLGIHHLEGTFACDADAKKNNCKTYINNDDILVRMKRANKNAAQGNSVTIKFKKTHRLVTAPIATSNGKASKFGTRRTKFNIMVKVPKAEGEHEGNTGFCYETEEDMKIKVTNPEFSSAHFADCIPGTGLYRDRQGPEATVCVWPSTRVNYPK